MDIDICHVKFSWKINPYQCQFDRSSLNENIARARTYRDPLTFPLLWSLSHFSYDHPRHENHVSSMCAIWRRRRRSQYGDVSIPVRRRTSFYLLISLAFSNPWKYLDYGARAVPFAWISISKIAGHVSPWTSNDGILRIDIIPF